MSERNPQQSAKYPMATNERDVYVWIDGKLYCIPNCVIVPNELAKEYEENMIETKRQEIEKERAFRRDNSLRCPDLPPNHPMNQ